MKVFLVAPYPPPYGGIANWTKLIVSYAKSNNEDVDIELMNIAPAKRSFEGRTLVNRIVVGGFNMLRKRSILKKKLKTSPPDVIHITTSGQFAVIRDITLMKIANRYHIPVVYHIRFGKMGGIIKYGGKWRRLYCRALNKADRILVLDQNTYRALKDVGYDKKLELIPNPVNIALLPLKNVVVDKTVVFLGWVIPEKGICELIEAWNSIGREFPEYKLKIIGGYNNNFFEKLIQNVQCETVEFLGEKGHEEAMRILARCAVFVLPSYTEGFPNAVVEAMALGKAVIATNVGAIPEMLDSNCGMVIPAKNPKALTEALRYCIKNESFRKRIAFNAQCKAMEQYDVVEVFRNYKEIWAELIQEKVGG